MRITEIHPPINGGTLFFVRAVDARGRQFYFDITPEGEAVGVFREERNKLAAKAGMDVWKQIGPTPAIRKCARETMRVATA